MQIFGNINNKNLSGSGGKTATVGNTTVKIVRASSLILGTHPIRFYPLSPEYSQGADYPAIVQSFHWLNRQPILCRRTSYDYTVPDTQEKPLIDTSCPICQDRFAWFKKAKELGFISGAENNPPEAISCHKTGKELMERYSGVSVVSFIKNDVIEFPVVITYGKELLDAIQFHAERILESANRNICDPQKGYIFDIIVSTKTNSKRRSYKQSLPSMNNNIVDITKVPWNWKEICLASRSEIVDIPSSEVVKEFYLKNYGDGSSNQQFFHPAFKGESKSSMLQQNEVPNSTISNLGQQNLSVPEVPNSTISNLGQQNLSVPEVSTSKISNLGQQNLSVPEVSTFKILDQSQQNLSVPEVSTSKILDQSQQMKIFPCHASQLNSCGYDKSDSNCINCEQAKSCSDVKANKISLPVIASVDSIKEKENKIASDVQTKLDILRSTMN